MKITCCLCNTHNTCNDECQSEYMLTTHKICYCWNCIKTKLHLMNGKPHLLHGNNASKCPLLSKKELKEIEYVKVLLKLDCNQHELGDLTEVLAKLHGE